MDMEKEIKEVSKLLQDVNPIKTVILSHADHDGFSGSVMLNSYFQCKHNSYAKVVYPTLRGGYSSCFRQIISLSPEVIILLDVVLREDHKPIFEKLSKKTLIVNLDHHAILKIDSENYIDLNPHKWGKEYLNSSGLSWLILRQIEEKYFDERAWVAAIGAIQDYCFEDNLYLLRKIKEKGMLMSLDLFSLIDSNLMQLAKLINIGIQKVSPEYVYEKLLKACRENDITKVQNDSILRAHYEFYMRKFQETYLLFLARRKFFPSERLVAYNLQNQNPLFFNDICEKERQEMIYLGYRKGLLMFRSIFYNYDVRELAKLFDGNGPHHRVAGAKTNKSFERVIEIVRKILQQKSISSFV